MKVVLVHPAGSNWIPGQKDVTTAANRMVPIGLLSMAAYLEKSGHEALVYDCLGPNAPNDFNRNVKAIAALNPDMIGFTATTSSFLDAYKMAEALKKISANVKNVFGGIHASSMGGRLLNRFTDIDYLCLGEGEETICELADGVSPKNITGLAWRDGEEIKNNPPRLNLKSLDDLPFPAYEKLSGFPRGYRLPPFSYINIPGTNISTSRGCIYQCSYCDRSVFKRGFRSNSAQYIYEHMKMLRHRFGIRHINIYDDLFTMNRRRITKLCTLLAQEPLGLHFNCAIHAGHVDDDLLTMLKDAGCLMISVGIESGDPVLLERHKTSVSLEQVSEVVAKIQAKDIRAKGLFMMGLPGETRQSVFKTSDYIISLGLDDMNMTKFTPFPGAPCWSGINDEGIFDENWPLMNCLNFVYVPEAFKSANELDELYNYHVKRFYSDKKWRKKFRRRMWQHRHTLWYFIKNVVPLLKAKRHFEPKSKLKRRL